MERPCPVVGHAARWLFGRRHRCRSVGAVRSHGGDAALCLPEQAWRKLHIGMDADTGQILAATLTASDVDDASQVGPLLDQIMGPLASFTADGAYDQEGVYGDVAARHPMRP